MLDGHIHINGGLLAHVWARHVAPLDHAPRPWQARGRAVWRVSVPATAARRQGALVHDRAAGWAAVLAAVLAASREAA